MAVALAFGMCLQNGGKIERQGVIDQISIVGGVKLKLESGELTLVTQTANAVAHSVACHGR